MVNQFESPPPEVDTIGMAQCVVAAERVEHVFAESTVESHDVTLFKARELQEEGEEMKLFTSLWVLPTLSVSLLARCANPSPDSDRPSISKNT